ncbi:MAG: CAP domain-containing protein [Pseudomonadota bacterium]
MPVAPNAFFHAKRPRRRRVRIAVSLAVLLATATAQAGDEQELLTLINDYREAPDTCAGQPVEPVGPLAPEARLARSLVTSAAQLQGVLQGASYQAATAQVINVSGPGTVAAAMNAIKGRYCSALLDPQFAEIGVLRSAATWQLILARPLLAPDLGDWQAAGREVLRQVNQARGEARRCGDRTFQPAAPLGWNARLAAAALVHSREMAGKHYFSHTGQDGRQVDARATAAGYAWRAIGENIAAGQGSAQQAVAGWLSSPGHCANLMRPDFTEMGAAYALDPASPGAIYWTQVFGRPR